MYVHTIRNLRKCSYLIEIYFLLADEEKKMLAVSTSEVWAEVTLSPGSVTFAVIFFINGCHFPDFNQALLTVFVVLC